MAPRGSPNKRHAAILHALCHLNETQRKALLSKADTGLIQCICECALNVLQGNVVLKKGEKKRLKRHAYLLRRLTEKRKSLNSKKRVIIQNGGFLPLLLAPILGTLLSKIIG